MIVALRNAGEVGRESLRVPFSKLKEDIASVLKKEGFIKSFEKKTQGSKNYLQIELLVDNRTPRIRGVKRISKISKRIYRKATELTPVKSGYGITVLSTPKGVISNKEARKEGVGGEVLFSIW